MVMRLPPPLVDCVALVSTIVAERVGGVNAAYFASVEQEWRTRVQQYLDAEGSPPTVTKWPAIEPRKGSFLNLYLHPGDNSAQGRILLALRQHELLLCPACGEQGRPQTLDHYLPKSTYPHFCVTPANLFPMCDACQQAKGSKVGDIRSPRYFIHPYYDVFVGEQVLSLEIRAPFEAPAFVFGAADDLEPAETRLVESHIRELGLTARYTVFFRNQHRRLLRLVDRMRASNQDVRATLETFRFDASHQSVNSWEHVFYEAVLENAALMDYLCNAQLPPLL
ncbi:hypothetical protein LMG18091_00018 [Ralstonia wenshanensis]|uniref:HNH endonuclease n=1 Tax=Ralstonia wenshanensis TaxID=2842456 RepID=A0AAD2EJR1_9RALS|nr:hypothetical protein LMG18091_00018 [Ralstonia wenshanensis]